MQITCLSCRHLINVTEPEPGRTATHRCKCGCHLKLETTDDESLIVTRDGNGTEIDPNHLMEVLAGENDFEGPFNKIIETYDITPKDQGYYKESQLRYLKGRLLDLEAAELYEACPEVVRQIKELEKELTLSNLHHTL